MDKDNEAQNERVLFQSDDVFIPFCGRIDELSLILEAFERCKNECNVVWIHGASGVGKSKLVQQCFTGKVNYCYGKFDFLASSKPYSIIVKVMSDIIKLLLDSVPGVRLAPDQAFMLTKLVPDIRKVLNYEGIEELSFNKDFQEVRGKSGEWSFQKLKEAVKTFVKGACEQLMLLSSIPLIWFVDDFQWADLKSLEIITYLLSGELRKGFLFVGSYRDGETPEDGPFGALKKAVHQSAAKVTDILLSNLTKSDIHNFVTDLTNNQLENSESLADKIYAKTNGYPLFTTYSVQYLLEKGVLNYSMESEKWIYNEHDDFLVFFESAFDVFMFSLYSLHSETLETLKIASCIGLDVDIPLLESVLNELDVTATPEKLKAVLREANSRHVIVIDPTEKKFTFAHDRIREAAYELASSVETHEAIHLKIGRHIIRLFGCVLEADVVDRTLFAVNQLNRGRSLIHANFEKIELARYNIKAAEKLIEVSAFQLAQDNLKVAIELLGQDKWNDPYDLTMQAHLLHSVTLFGNGFMDEAQLCVDEMCVNSKNDEDWRDAQMLHLEVLNCKNQLKDCIRLALELLLELDHPKFPRNPGVRSIVIAFIRVKRLIGKLTDDEILNLPECHNSKVLSRLRILGILGLAAGFSGKDSMIPITTCQMLELSLRYGVNEFAPYALSCFAFALTMKEDFDGAFRFGSLALQLMERFGEDPKTQVTVYGIFYHIKKPLLDSINPTLRAYYLAFAQGDLTFAGQASLAHIFVRYMAGAPLNFIVDDIFSFCDQLRSYNQKMVWDQFVIFQRSCLELINQSEDIIRLTGTYFDDDSFVIYLTEQNSYSQKTMFQHCLQTFSSRYILGKIDSALKHAKFCWKSYCFQGAFAFKIEYFLFSALIALDYWRKGNRFRRYHFWLIFRKYHRKLMSWTVKGNPNTNHLVVLLDAEFLAARSDANPDNVKSLFDASIAKASRAGFLHNAALANERAGEYFLRQGDMYWTQHYLGRAIYLYADWGAVAKVSQMEEKHNSWASTEFTEFPRSIPIVGRSRQDTINQVETLRRGPRQLFP